MNVTDTDTDRPGLYVTDGVSLFRILGSPTQPPRGGVVAVEDCDSLDVLFIRSDRVRRLRHVGTSRRRTRGA